MSSLAMLKFKKELKLNCNTNIVLLLSRGMRVGRMELW